MVYGTVGRAAVLQQLREHLRRNMVKFGRTWHCQARGIPQVGDLGRSLPHCVSNETNCLALRVLR